MQSGEGASRSASSLARIRSFEREYDFETLVAHEPHDDFAHHCGARGTSVHYDERVSFDRAWKLCAAEARQTCKRDDDDDQWRAHAMQNMTLVVFRYHTPRHDAGGKRDYADVAEACDGCHEYAHAKLNELLACTYRYVIARVKKLQLDVFKELALGDGADDDDRESVLHVRVAREFVQRVEQYRETRAATARRDGGVQCHAPDFARQVRVFVRSDAAEAALRKCAVRGKVDYREIARELCEKGIEHLCKFFAHVSRMSLAAATGGAQDGGAREWNEPVQTRHFVGTSYKSVDYAGTHTERENSLCGCATPARDGDGEITATLAALQCIHRRVVSNAAIDQRSDEHYYHVRDCARCCDMPGESRLRSYDSSELSVVDSTTSVFSVPGTYDNPLHAPGDNSEPTLTRCHSGPPTTGSSLRARRRHNQRQPPPPPQQQQCHQEHAERAHIDTNYVTLDNLVLRPFALTGERCGAGTGAEPAADSGTDGCPNYYTVNAAETSAAPRTSRATLNSPVCVPAELARVLRFNLAHVDDKCCAVPFYVHRECSLRFVMHAFQAVRAVLHASAEHEASLYDTHAWVRDRADTVAKARFPLSRVAWSGSLHDFVHGSRDFTYSTEEAHVSRALSPHRAHTLDYERSFAYVGQGVVLDMHLVSTPRLFAGGTLGARLAHPRAAHFFASFEMLAARDVGGGTAAAAADSPVGRQELRVEAARGDGVACPPSWLRRDHAEVRTAEADAMWDGCMDDTRRSRFESVARVYERSKTLRGEFEQHLSAFNVLRDRANAHSRLWSLGKQTVRAMFAAVREHTGLDKRRHVAPHHATAVVADALDAVFYTLVAKCQLPGRAIAKGAFYRHRLVHRIAIQAATFLGAQWFQCYFAWRAIKDLLGETSTAPRRRNASLQRKRAAGREQPVEPRDVVARDTARTSRRRRRRYEKLAHFVEERVSSPPPPANRALSPPPPPPPPPPRSAEEERASPLAAHACDSGTPARNVSDVPLLSPGPVSWCEAAASTRPTSAPASASTERVPDSSWCGAHAARALPPGHEESGKAWSPMLYTDLKLRAILRPTVCDPKDQRV